LLFTSWDNAGHNSDVFHYPIEFFEQFIVSVFSRQLARPTDSQVGSY